MSGTSMAVPQVAGASAVILEKSPDLEPLDVKRILMRSADDLGEIGPDNTFGWGALNLTEALQMLDHPVSEPSIEGLYLSNESASVGDPISVEARLSGEVESALVRIDGPGKEMEVAMSDFDLNGIYTARLETNFWDTGCYTLEVELLDMFGERKVERVPFCLI
jgi:serine protease AprX